MRASLILAHLAEIRRTDVPVIAVDRLPRQTFAPVIAEVPRRADIAVVALGAWNRLSGLAPDL